MINSGSSKIRRFSPGFRNYCGHPAASLFCEPFNRQTGPPMSSVSWKEKLAGQISEPWNAEIEQFEAQIELRKQGKIDEKVFAETRLRRGAYGQRYDNGQRHDGLTTQRLSYSTLTKGPDTFFDAPG